MGKTKETVIVMRSCPKSMITTNGFQWPKKGIVKCHDWKPTKDCGSGLHGLLSGQNDPGQWYKDGVILGLEVEKDSIIDLGGKVKFPKCKVVYCGDMSGFCAKYHGTWYCGTATAGDFGTATAGDYGTAIVGYCGRATAGQGGTATAGDCGRATAWDCGTATAGNHGTATAEYRGTATAGDFGKAIVGNGGTATAGDFGTATAGESGTATAGDCGIIIIKWHDGQRCRISTAYVGENGIEPNVKYKLDDNGNFIKA